VLDLKGKLEMSGGVAEAQTLQLMESDTELEETLVGFGYTKQQAKSAVGKIDLSIIGFKERLREALKKAKA